MGWKRNTACAGLVLGQFVGAARPFCTDDAGTVAPGSFETELGTEAWTDAADFGIGFKHGITSRMDLGISLAGTAYPGADRSWAPAEISIKFALVPEWLAASFRNPLGTTDYHVDGIVSRSLGNLGIDLNAGGEFEGGGRSTRLTWGVHPWWELGAATLGLEWTGDLHDQHANLDWRAGAQCRLASNFALDAAVGSTLESDPQWKVIAGAWFAFGTSEGDE